MSHVDTRDLLNKMSDVDENVSEQTEEETITPHKKNNVTATESDSGIIYLSRIPPFMSVKKIRQIFSAYGEVDRIFLQPDVKCPAHKKNRTFTEGWVEFRKKKLAKRVAFSLNNTQIGGKRRSRWFDEIWNIKYLPKFKWGHLNERLAYEKAVRQQRLRTEVSQAKREVNFYTQKVEQNRILRKLEKKSKAKGEVFKQRNWGFKQLDTEEEIVAKKRKQNESESVVGEKRQRISEKRKGNGVKRAADNKSFLKTLFSGGVNRHDDEES